MLERLGSAISAELTAIESIERRADEGRRIRYAVAVGFVSAVAIPASLVLAFLGINASELHSNLSMFSRHSCVPHNSARLEVPVAGLSWGNGRVAGCGACL